jgi:2-iminoacetate synthase ThiH
MITAHNTIEEIEAKIAQGERLSFEDGLHLFQHPNLTDVGALAQLARRRSRAPETVTYAAGVHLTWERLESSGEKAERLLSALSEAGGSLVAITGAIPDEWGLEHVVGLLSRLKEAHPGAEVMALTPYQVTNLAEGIGYSAADVLKACRDAGLAALGPWTFRSSSDHPELALDGGDSLLSDLQAAREIGVASVVRVELPPSESPETRLIRLTQLREVQDLSGCLLTLAPLNAEPGGKLLGSAYDYLRAVAVARLMADNVPHVQCSWEAHDLKIAQLALQYGADDFGTVWLEALPNVPGPVFSHPIEEVERNIREAGFTPQARTARYEPLPTPHLPDSPTP